MIGSGTWISRTGCGRTSRRGGEPGTRAIMPRDPNRFRPQRRSGRRFAFSRFDPSRRREATAGGWSRAIAYPTAVPLPLKILGVTVLLVVAGFALDRLALWMARRE